MLILPAKYPWGSLVIYHKNYWFFFSSYSVMKIIYWGCTYKIELCVVNSRNRFWILKNNNFSNCFAVTQYTIIRTTARVSKITEKNKSWKKKRKKNKNNKNKNNKNTRNMMKTQKTNFCNSVNILFFYCVLFLRFAINNGKK